MRLASLAVCALVLLAGCSFGVSPNPSPDPTATPDPLQLNVTNAGDEPLAVTVGLTNRSVDRAHVTYTNGTERTVEVPVDGIARLYSVTNVSAVRPATGQEVIRRYELTPGSAARAPIDAPPVGGSVFLTVRGGDGEVDHWGVATCAPGERLRAVDFFVHPTGVGMGVGCST